jgi:hypothetical protein
LKVRWARVAFIEDPLGEQESGHPLEASPVGLLGAAQGMTLTEVGRKVKQLIQVFAEPGTEPYSLRVYPKPNDWLLPQYAQGVTVKLLNEPESDSVQSQRQTLKNSSKSASKHPEWIDGISKNVTQLKPIINKLMHKVIMITICQS